MTIGHRRCRWCAGIVHRDPADPAADRWVHARSVRARCPDGQHDAQPRPPMTEAERVERLRAASAAARAARVGENPDL